MGTKRETSDTDKGAPAGHRASPYQPSQPETEPYKGVFLMGDKGGKKDKKKAQDQKNEKQRIKDKKKKDKEPKKLT